MADHSATFKQKTVQSVLQLHFKDEKTKVNPDGLNLMTELLRAFASEAAERAAVQAKKEGSKLVTTEHVEKILPQLRYELTVHGLGCDLDFSIMEAICLSFWMFDLPTKEMDENHMHLMVSGFW